jgi:DNA-binding NtrC family response regulator
VNVERAQIVLIVEDDFVIRITLAEFLSDCGFEVYEAANAEEAMVELARVDIDIDVVFTDVRMPGRMDGFGLANWVQENRPGLPVLITSGNIGETNRGHKLAVGANFFAKPYDLDAVEGQIRRTIAERRSA